MTRITEPVNLTWNERVLWRLCLIGNLNMRGAEEKLKTALEGYSNFPREKKLTLPKHQPHLVRRVRQFLLFAREHSDYTFEQTLDLFLAALGQRDGIKPWQIQQASDTIRIYRYQYRRYRSRGEVEQKGIGVSGNGEGVIERLREVIRLRHYARSTEKTYLHWARRFLAYRKHAGLTGEPTAADVREFLTRLAMVEKVSASTQNQAFSALLLLFREVLHKDLDEIAQTIRAKRGRRLPTVLSITGAWALFEVVEPDYKLMVKLLYGSGFRLMALLRFRVKDIDFEAELITIRSGKGGKNRTTLLPESLREELRTHLAKVREWHQADLADGSGAAPYCLSRHGNRVPSGK